VAAEPPLWEGGGIATAKRATIHSVPSTRKQIPSFSTEDEEREFWSDADSTEYIDWSKAKELRLARLKPTPRTSESIEPSDN